MEFEVNHTDDGSAVCVFVEGDCVDVWMHGANDGILITKSELKEIFVKVFAEEEK